MTALQNQVLQSYLSGTSWPNSCIFCTFKAFFSTTCFPLSEETIAILSILLHSFHLGLKGCPGAYAYLFQLSSSWWPLEEKVRCAEQHVLELKKGKNTQLCSCKDLRSHEYYSHSQNWILLEAGLKMTGKSTLINGLEKAVQLHCHFYKHNSIIFSSVWVKNKNISESRKKTPVRWSSGLPRGQGLMIRTEQRELYVFTFGREENLC